MTQLEWLYLVQEFLERAVKILENDNNAADRDEEPPDQHNRYTYSTKADQPF